MLHSSFIFSASSLQSSQSQISDMSSPGPSFKQVTPDFAIDGGVAASGLDFLANNFKGALYLCKDGADMGWVFNLEKSKCLWINGSVNFRVEGGYSAIQTAFGERSSEHKPVDPSNPCFSADCGIDPNKRNAVVASYEWVGHNIL